jgi:hypothetical protein
MANKLARPRKRPQPPPPAESASFRACGRYGGPAAKVVQKISYDGYRFSPVVIQQAIWLYLRFTLSSPQARHRLAFG